MEDVLRELDEIEPSEPAEPYPVSETRKRRHYLGKGRCDTCGYALYLGYPPAPGGATDGVACSCEAVAERDGMTEEYKEYGYLNLWRYEVISELDEDNYCENWAPKPYAVAEKLSEEDDVSDAVYDLRGFLFNKMIGQGAFDEDTAGSEHQTIIDEIIRLLLEMV